MEKKEDDEDDKDDKESLQEQQSLNHWFYSFKKEKKLPPRKLSYMDSLKLIHKPH